MININKIISITMDGPKPIMVSVGKGGINLSKLAFTLNAPECTDEYRKQIASYASENPNFVMQLQNNGNIIFYDIIRRADIIHRDIDE
jgi:hypothetical protein